MSEQRTIVTTSDSTAIAIYGDDQQIAQEMRVLRASLPNLGKKDDNGKYIVSDALVYALVVASKWSGLSPYRAEIYADPNLGVTVSAKIKAADAITAAARRGDSLDIRYHTITQDSPEWMEYAEEYNLKLGDTVRGIEIISSRARRDYYAERLARIDELKAIGYVRTEIEAKLKEEFSGAPVYRAIGMVKGSEIFGTREKRKANKFVAFEDTDRADKRALQRCLNKHGLAAPDQRQYGGVAVDKLPSEDEPDAGYTVRPGTIETDNAQPETRRVEPEQHASNAAALGRNDDESLLDAGKPETPAAQPETLPGKMPEADNKADPKVRLLKHKAEASTLSQQLRDAGHTKEADEIDKVIRTANTALERGQGASTMHSIATRLDQLCELYAALLQPAAEIDDTSDLAHEGTEGE